MSGPFIVLVEEIILFYKGHKLGLYPHLLLLVTSVCFFASAAFAKVKKAAQEAHQISKIGGKTAKHATRMNNILDLCWMVGRMQRTFPPLRTCPRYRPIATGSGRVHATRLLR